MPDVQLQKYDWAGYFSKDSLFRTEVPTRDSGIAGDPVPYSVQSDDVITTLLLCCFILALIAFSTVKSFLGRQARRFFYFSNEENVGVTETAGEVRFQLFLVFVDSLLIALLYYFYTLQVNGECYVLDSQYQLIAIFLGIVLVYFFLKMMLYVIVNNVFFDGKRNEQWMRAFLFVVSVEGVLLFPAVLIQGYLNLSVQNVETYVAFVLIFVKLLTFYKLYIIFFRRNVVRLQIILYLCALEIIPMFTLMGILDLTVESLKINL